MNDGCSSASMGVCQDEGGLLALVVRRALTVYSIMKYKHHVGDTKCEGEESKFGFEDDMPPADAFSLASKMYLPLSGLSKMHLAASVSF